jgi:uncharacterized radical SAM superfamily Fe-S cluster-containing enzyme
VTLARHVNDGEVGELVDFAAQQPCVRGITFQPVQHAGRTEHYDAARQRLTLGEVRSLILEQSALFAPEDIIPVPCNPDALAMAYALKTPGGLMPLTRYLPPEHLLAGPRNTIAFERDPQLKDLVFRLFSTGHGPEGQAQALGSLLCCLPAVGCPDLTYSNVFRVLIMQFMDAWSFDVRAMKKSCVHIVQSDGRLIPFEAFNLLYRDDRIGMLEERRKEQEQIYSAEP